MSKFKEKEKKVYRKEYPIYSNQELRELEKDLEKYRITKTLSNGEVISYCDTVQYLVAEGAMRDERTVRDIPKYEELQDKLGQLNNLQKKTEYAKKMEVEQLAKNMQVEDAPSLDDLDF
jgi:hypothetical protein